ncbi:MAG TPA: MarR family transcriptional regulator [Prosthecochloris aestuarii]|uniref:MarR family transcriptional regulator n=1 Tax=Prosthecochloris aestuarii TaxID=1102 RepID=A0A831WVJ6_PROAE|nr:MarR family transcriptional regulator [Prosthecochloris aestuarii]
MTPDQGLHEEFSSASLHSLRRIIRALDVHSRKLYRECNITSPQIHCLHNLTQKGTQTLSSLARELHLSLSTVNGIIDRLESRGMVLRTRSTEDQRKVMIAITDEGRALLLTVPELMKDLYTQAFGKLEKEDQKTLAHLLGRLANHFDPHNEPQGHNTEIIQPTHDVISSPGTDYQLH